MPPWLPGRHGVAEAGPIRPVGGEESDSEVRVLHEREPRPGIAGHHSGLRVRGPGSQACTVFRVRALGHSLPHL